MMKRPKYTFLTFFLFFALATTFAQDTIFRSANILLASRNGVEDVYSPGAKLVLKYRDGLLIKKARGRFSGICEGKILITKGNKNRDTVFVPVDNIAVLRKIHPIKRIVFAAIGTTLIAVGGAIIDNGGNSPGSAIQGAFIIPVIGVGVGFIGAVPGSLIREKINEKKYSSGWRFSLH